MWCEGMNGWTPESSGRERAMTSPQSLFPANPFRVPPHPNSILSPPSHTSLLLLRQQHHPAWLRHCLGLIVMQHGVHVMRQYLQSSRRSRLLSFLFIFYQIQSSISTSDSFASTPLPTPFCTFHLTMSMSEEFFPCIVVFIACKMKITESVIGTN